MAEEKLHKRLTIGKSFLGGEDAYRNRVPDFIYDNLRDDWGQRDYQQEALGRFVYYWRDYDGRPKGQPIQLLYQMATGSGKTVIMAGLILYLYEQGYRNFLFFVNSTNIIDKTKDNFLNPTAYKYLFDRNIQIDDKQIRVREVDNFSAANQNDINIVFSTIQGLHTRLNNPRENSVTYEDFEDHKTVLISDEAHHINAETRKGKDLNQTELLAVTSWEHTVSKIFESHNDNLLLEFTATADLNNPDILKKYKEKVIFDYPLKEFRKDGYSKEVKVLQADLDEFDRALQAIILNQFRYKLFASYGQLIKPVILFKSRVIKESKEFYEKFRQRMKTISETDLEKIRSSPNLDEVLQKIFTWLDNQNITLANFASELREDFSDEKCISVNSESESQDKQLAINTLEDEDNAYRAIFAVDKLNEGWDVLNLFDIVRLYNTRDSQKGKPGKTTMSEAQLIGRGARYCPFAIDEDQPHYQRKFDVRGDEEEHELKICEELYYHSSHNPRYIDELHTALEQIGIRSKEHRQLNLFLKPEFKETPIYKSGVIYLNEKQKYKGRDIKGISEDFKKQTQKYRISTGVTGSSGIFSPKQVQDIKTVSKDYYLSEFGETLLRKAIDRLEFYHFANLRIYFPNLKSIEEFITSRHYLNSLKIEVVGPIEAVKDLSVDQKLEATISVLTKLSSFLKANRVDYKGTHKFKPHKLKDTFTDKTMNIARDDGGDREYGIAQSETGNEDLRIDLDSLDWYAFQDNYGTTEEKYLIKYIQKMHEQLKSQYDEIYLLRNEHHFKLYNFSDGRAIEPDFVLYLKRNEPKKTVHYQIFIEPKGEHLIEHDKWKEEFLKVLKNKHEFEQLWSDHEFQIWGMPFYNEEKTKREFEEYFEGHLIR